MTRVHALTLLALFVWGVALGLLTAWSDTTPWARNVLDWYLVGQLTSLHLGLLSAAAWLLLYDRR